MTANGDGVVTDSDVRSADAILETLKEGLETQRVLDGLEGQRLQLSLRGLLASWSADVRTAGYLEGLQVGRRVVGQRLRDVLEEEGL